VSVARLAGMNSGLQTGNAVNEQFIVLRGVDKISRPLEKQAVIHPDYTKVPATFSDRGLID